MRGTLKEREEKHNSYYVGGTHTKGGYDSRVRCEQWQLAVSPPGSVEMPPIQWYCLIMLPSFRYLCKVLGLWTSPYTRGWSATRRAHCPRAARSRRTCSSSCRATPNASLQQHGWCWWHLLSWRSGWIHTSPLNTQG